MSAEVPNKGKIVFWWQRILNIYVMPKIFDACFEGSKT